MAAVILKAFASEFCRLLPILEVEVEAQAPLLLKSIAASISIRDCIGFSVAVETGHDVGNPRLFFLLLLFFYFKKKLEQLP